MTPFVSIPLSEIIHKFEGVVLDIMSKAKLTSVLISPLLIVNQFS